MQGIAYLNRKKKFGIVKVRFREVAIARVHSATPLKTEKVVLLLAYLGRRASRVSVEEFLPEVDIAWPVTAILLGIEIK